MIQKEKLDMQILELSGDITNIKYIIETVYLDILDDADTGDREMRKKYIRRLYAVLQATALYLERTEEKIDELDTVLFEFMKTLNKKGVAE